MAEERLIDDDLNKDKKYKVRINADGEEELYIDESDENEEENVYEIPDFEGDDEEAAVLTPEQLSARERARHEEEERRAKVLAENVARAEELISASQFDSALYNISLAEEVSPDDGQLCYLKMKALSKNMTDFSRLEDCYLAAEGVKSNCTAEQKAEFLSLSAQLLKECDNHEEIALCLQVENDDKKAERRQVFKASARRATVWFSVTGFPFLLFLALAIAFSTVMFGAQDGRYLILTIVFAALALVFLVASAFTLRRLWEAKRRLSLNEKNFSTKLGREYEEELEKVRKLKFIYSAFKED